MQSLQDSFFTNTNAYHSKAIHPPTSQASRLQKSMPETRALTPEELAMFNPMDENQAALDTLAYHDLPTPTT